MEWLNFRHLYAFWMVARVRNFTRAAKQMRVAQSAVSSQVASLEEYLGAKLFVRGHRSVDLTSAGRALLPRADAIFAQSRVINRFADDPAALDGPPVVSVGVVGGASRNFVFRLVEHHRRRSPGVRLSITTGSYPELLGMLTRFELDGIVTLELPRKKDLQHVSYRKLGQSPLCVVAQPALIESIREGSVEGPVDVFKFRHPYEVDVLGKHVQPRVGCPVRLALDTDDVPLLRFLANSGDGVAVMPRIGVLEDLVAGRVALIELPSCPEIQIYGITGGRSGDQQRDSPFADWSLPGELPDDGSLSG